MNRTYADVELGGSTIGSTDYCFGRPVGHLIALQAGWDVSPEWRAGGTAEIALDNADAAMTLPGYEVANLYASYTLRRLDDIEVRVDLRNVFDKIHASRSSDGIDSSAVIPSNEPGRTLAVTARVRF